MSDLEFYKLLYEWESTPEYQEYEKYCDTHEPKEENYDACLKLAIKAFSNDLGKRLCEEPKFQELIMKGLNIYEKHE